MYTEIWVSLKVSYPLLVTFKLEAFHFLYVLLATPGFSVYEIGMFTSLSLKEVNVKGDCCAPFVS